MPEQPEPDVDTLRDGLKRVAVALKETGLPFALTGGYAAWVRGAPERAHDVDFLVREDDAPQAKAELDRRGFEVVQPPEDWLFKVTVGEAVIDVLFRTQSGDIPGMLEAADEIEVLSVAMPVLSATDVLAEKLLALDEHYCDLATVLPPARALREQVDWAELRRRTREAPFAEAVLFLLDRLGVTPSQV
jgi:hypothetical protein